MAVSYYDERLLRVYRLGADCSTTLLHTVGTRAGAGPLQFDHPAKMCLTPAGNLLVCDHGDDRVLELSPLGESYPKLVRFIHVASARAIALHGDTLAVGTIDGIIKLLGCASRALIRSIGSKGSGPGQIGTRCVGLRFTPDGQFVVVAGFSNCWLSVFRISDGGFVKLIGAGVVGNGLKDVQFAPNGELLVADFGSHRVCVFSADGDTLLRTWGANGTSYGDFCYPNALALADSKLFVLDRDNARVQVFE
jgi:DNA-binding beta-propeller fold protein YncE